MEQTKPTAVTVFFCTVKNSSTNGMWQQSKQYRSMEELLKAMIPYLTKYPHSTVTYQTTVIFE